MPSMERQRRLQRSRFGQKVEWGKIGAQFTYVKVCDAYYPSKSNGIWIYEAWSPGEINVWVGDG